VTFDDVNGAETIEIIRQADTAKEIDPSNNDPRKVGLALISA